MNLSLLFILRSPSLSIPVICRWEEGIPQKQEATELRLEREGTKTPPPAACESAIHAARSNAVLAQNAVDGYALTRSLAPRSRV